MKAPIVKKQVIVLGSTGSIGRSTLEVIARHPNHFEVVALAAGANDALLEKQIRQFRPAFAYLRSADAAARLSKKFSRRVRFFSQAEGLRAFCRRAQPRAGTLLAATCGIEALEPVMDFLACGKTVALANKEILVAAGELVMARLSAFPKARLIPVDSEHSAIFQCLHGHPGDVQKIYLTGSGGPLRRIAKGKFAHLSKEAVINHPKWRMGKKISVDSATLMNKGLEVIEASWLFGLSVDRVEVLIHPEAIVHSMVEFVDGAVLAQMGVTDMKLPIQYALTYPRRLPGFGGLHWGSRELKRLSFFKPARRKFPCLDLAYEAARRGSTHPCVLSAADETAVEAYLDDKISFEDIPRIIEKVMSRHKHSGPMSVARIRQVHDWAVEQARGLCN